jgi:serine/threonine protein kinase
MKLVYAFQTPANLFMALEYCENGDLSQMLDEYSLFDEKVAKFLIAELILGIKCLHSKGILFRDLKPENILVDSMGHIRLADFGLAKQGKEGQDIRAQSFCGSPAYLAPEMLKKEGVTKSGDVYQIGVVLYEMLVSIPPYYNDNVKILYQNIEKGKLKIPKYLSSEAKKCLLKMLHRNPAKRPSLEQL